ncbi:unnamed protein product [Spirodela intermedia]|uniref:MADS-box domain-containing protein n=1 Tax=Spirodela intermedia TaxID=51605 RepID=A0A7I8JD98_SPIIN|nr:unnamed protein product [Spirodela intermedia]CAA6668137.1 unnamed protein product [Spirodela intermedia]
MKRRAVIKRKAMELGKLCDIVTLLVCFGPRGQLETWPEDRQEVRRIIEHYASLNPDDCIKRRYDLTTFFEAHFKRLQAQVNRERNSWLDALPAADSLEDLLRSLDEKLAAIEEKIYQVELEEEEESRGKDLEACWGQHLQALEAVPPTDIDVFDPSMTFPLSFCRDTSLGSGMEHLNALPFEHPDTTSLCTISPPAATAA